MSWSKSSLQASPRPSPTNEEVKLVSINLYINKCNSYEYLEAKLTIRIQLIWIENQSAVVFVIRDAIIIIIVVTGISFTILVVVSLVRVGDVRAVVKVVLVTVLIDILVAVTFVSNTVRIRVELLRVRAQNQ